VWEKKEEQQQQQQQQEEEEEEEEEEEAWPQRAEHRAAPHWGRRSGSCRGATALAGVAAVLHSPRAGEQLRTAVQTVQCSVAQLGD